jgi:hypothetical protein
MPRPGSRVLRLPESVSVISPEHLSPKVSMILSVVIIPETHEKVTGAEHLSFIGRRPPLSTHQPAPRASVAPE